MAPAKKNMKKALGKEWSRYFFVNIFFPPSSMDITVNHSTSWC